MSPCPAVLGDCRQEGVICTPLLQSKLPRMNVAALTQLEASAAFWAPLAAKTPPGDLLRAPPPQQQWGQVLCDPGTVANSPETSEPKQRM